GKVAVRPVRAGIRRDSVTEVEQAIPRFREEAAALQNLDEVDETEGSKHGESVIHVLSVRSPAHVGEPGNPALPMRLFEHLVVQEVAGRFGTDWSLEIRMNRVAQVTGPRILLTGDDEMAVALE